MKTFKEGDRVTHQDLGVGTVKRIQSWSELVVVDYDLYGTAMTPVRRLSPVIRESPVEATPVFKVGDRVSHPLHRDGTVEEISEFNGLITVNIGGGRLYMALPYQIKHAVPEPTYHICINEITGAAHVPGNLTAKEVANYISENVDWRVVQEIKITKEGN